MSFYQNNPEIQSIDIPENKLQHALNDCNYDIGVLGHRTPAEVPLAIGEYLGLEGKTVCDLGCSSGWHFPNWARCGASHVIGIEKDQVIHDNPCINFANLQQQFPSTDFKIYRGNFWGLVPKYPEQFEADVYYAWGFAKGKQSFKDSYVEMKKMIKQLYSQGKRNNRKYLVSLHGIQFLEHALSISDKVVHFESKEWLSWKGKNTQKDQKNKPPWSWSKDFFLGIHVIE